MNKKQKAVQTLDSYLNELDYIDSIESGALWSAKVYDSISRYIPDGDMKIRFRQLTFTIYENYVYDRTNAGRPMTRTRSVFSRTKIPPFVNAINEIKNYIETHGLIDQASSSTKSNLVSNLSQIQFVSLTASVLVFVGGGLFGVGFYFGTEKINGDYIEYKNENKELRKEMFSLQSNHDSIRKVLHKRELELDFRTKEAKAIRNEYEYYVSTQKK